MCRARGKTRARVDQNHIFTSPYIDDIVLDSFPWFIRLLLIIASYIYTRNRVNLALDYLDHNHFF